jgi:hypothetical protein
MTLRPLRIGFIVVIRHAGLCVAPFERRDEFAHLGLAGTAWGG